MGERLKYWGRLMNTRNLRFTYLQTNNNVDMHNLARVTDPSALRNAGGVYVR